MSLASFCLACSAVAVLGIAALATVLFFAARSPRSRAWNAAHEAAWAGYSEPDEKGLSRLQRECREIVDDFATVHGLVIHVEQATPAAGFEEWGGWLHFELPEIETEVWLYEDQVDLYSEEERLRLEYWDAQPEEMKRQLSEKLDLLAPGVAGDLG